MRLSSLNILGITGSPLPLHLAMWSNWNSPCCHPSTVFPWKLLPPPKHLPSTLQASSFQINMVSSTSRSTTRDRTSPTLKRKTLLPFDTLRTTNGQGVGSLVELGLGLLELGLRSLVGSRSLLFGCGASPCRWSWQRAERKYSRYARE